MNFDTNPQPKECVSPQAKELERVLEARYALVELKSAGADLDSNMFSAKFGGTRGTVNPFKDINLGINTTIINYFRDKCVSSTLAYLQRTVVSKSEECK